MLPPVGYFVETVPFLSRSVHGYDGIYVDMWRDFLGEELRLESRIFSGVVFLIVRKALLNFETESSLINLVGDLSSSKRTFIINRSSNLLLSHKIEFFQEERPSVDKLQIISDPKQVLDKICSSHRFAYFDVDEFVETIGTSDMSKFATDSALRAEHFGREAPIVFYYSKVLFNRTRLLNHTLATIHKPAERRETTFNLGDFQFD
ncbi:hypothetical protein PRIPAC_86273 [Pristionchus pacificus]|uniref:Uncharacterized protein n=1 Tax=Pristionchus pacificus TaxID=54126 RepID=A0A2A6BS22_PRIPA|nr:hypothetical protein PRIPAC_86273 [Pristionchus pacificus]|eukprot:PDM68667.1 hypothetical protein PRIPAC_46969 [Pristionchus pacificus]